MIGVELAGGLGTRFRPVTSVASPDASALVGDEHDFL
jgi:hypothetical protein